MAPKNYFAYGRHIFALRPQKLSRNLVTVPTFRRIFLTSTRLGTWSKQWCEG